MAICKICGKPVISGVVVHTECLGDKPNKMHDLVRQLRRLSIERRPEACLGCGSEHGCSVHGCAVIKQAADAIAELQGKLAQYKQAEAEGRLVICPDKLYDLMFDECSPEEAYITEYKTEGLYISFAGDYIAPEEIGGTVFLTREDAEAALKERTSNDNIHL